MNVGKIFVAMLRHDCLKFSLLLYRWATKWTPFDRQL